MDRLEQNNIVTEIKDSFLEYSMSVIVSRALPDLRDGLKPVHRRILYDMLQNGLTPDKHQRLSLVMLWVNITHMEILVFMRQW